MKQMLLMLLFTLTLSAGEKSLRVHYLDGRVVDHHIKDIKEVTFLTLPDVLQLDSVTYVKTSGAISPKYSWRKEFTLTSDDTVRVLHYDGYDTLTFDSTYSLEKPPYYKHFAPYVMQENIRSLHGTYTDDKTGGPTYYQYFYYNDEVITTIGYTTLDSTILPKAISVLHNNFNTLFLGDE